MHKEIEIPEGYEAKIEDNKVIIKPIDSEDERIRKRLVKYFKFYQSTPNLTLDVNTWQGEKVSDILAYLERQKDAIEAARQQGYEEGMENGASMVESMQKKQKPAEWSEEDEINRQIAIGKFEGTEVALEWDIEQRVIKWLKSLPERINLPPKQEWSEEEERHLYNAIEAVKYVYDISEGTNGFKCVEFLKSFRPQPHWKPSKEQMKALNAVANEGVLLDLFNDLLKLF